MITGKAIVFGDNIDTDQIIGAHHLTLASVAEMAPFAFEHHPHFVSEFTPGDIIVGGENFGCGSSREQAVGVLRERGVGAVVAAGFARIFFRNAINLGLPVIICPQAATIRPEERLKIEGDCLRVVETARCYLIEPLPSFVRDIVAHGGIIAMLRDRAAGEVLKR